MKKNQRRISLKGVTMPMDIIWIKPSLNEESCEYFCTPETNDLFKRLGYNFADKDAFLRFFNPLFDNGRFVRVDYHLTEAEGIGNIISMEPVRLEELQERVKTDIEYGRNYDKMLAEVQKGKPVTLPAPIYFYFKKEVSGFYFSGDRRKLLAYNLKLPLKVWWVEIHGAGNNCLRKKIYHIANYATTSRKIHY